MENQFTFRFDFWKRASMFLFPVCLGAYFFLFGYFNQSLTAKNIFYILSILSSGLLVYAFLYKPVVYASDYKTLVLKNCFQKKEIHIEEVLWYSRNVKNGYGIFCKSNTNFCLFYEGKKIFISVKETEDFERFIEARNIQYTSGKELGKSQKRSLVIRIASVVLSCLITFLAQKYMRSFPNETWIDFVTYLTVAITVFMAWI